MPCHKSDAVYRASTVLRVGQRMPRCLLTTEIVIETRQAVFAQLRRAEITGTQLYTEGETD